MNSEQEENKISRKISRFKLGFNDEIQLVNYKSDTEIADSSAKQQLKMSLSSHNIPCIKIDTEQDQEKEHELDENDHDVVSSLDTIENNNQDIDDELLKLSLPPCTIVRRGSMDNLIMRKYQYDYNLKENQYFLIKDFFDTYSIGDDELIDRNLFQNHLIKYSQNKARIELKANEADIIHSLEVIDSDSNYFIDFNEFLDYLTLFFASKLNLKKKLISVLNGHQYSHATSGYLNMDEAKFNFEFLTKFYNIQQDVNFFDLNLEKQVEDEEEDISYSKFADLIYPYLEPYLYVRH